MLVFAAALACGAARRCDAHSSGLAALEATPTHTGWSIEVRLPAEDLLAVLRAGFTPSGDYQRDLAPVNGALLAYVGRRLELSEGGAALTPRVSMNGFDCERARITVDVTAAGAVRLASRLLTELDRRYHIAVLHVDRTGRRSQGVVWPEGAPVELGGTTGAADAASALLRSFQLGVASVFTRHDHVLFLICLLLVPTTLSRLAALVLCFMLAHAIARASVALDWLALSPALVQPAIAASICYVAIENLFLHEAPDRWRVALAGGLAHGLGCAAPAGSLPGFELGVALGQLGLVLVLGPAMARIARRARFRDHVLPAVSLAILYLGLVWLLERIGR